MNKLKLTGKHILLLLLYSPGIENNINEPIKGRTRLIKMMFLFNEEIKKSFLSDSKIEIEKYQAFYPWDYGPFSKEIYDDIEFFINNRFIKSAFSPDSMMDFEVDELENWANSVYLETDKNTLLSDQNEEEFLLTDRGIKFVEEKIKNILSTNQIDILRKFKKNISETSLFAILRYIYMKYPDYTTKSKIKNNVLI